ncbi:MAG TPA: acyl-CoA synthetase [Burkholderiales bacterium]|jgi:predicted LPLAT superfamily acyltransferase|nr:acyl-CoA synthetase [Burkholderiales bacterium]
MSRAWLEQRERGNLAALRLMTWVARALGDGVARALLAPICWYFLAFAPRARSASRAFLARALGRRATLGDVYRHFHTFACTLLDRVAVLSGNRADFDVRLNGADAIEAALAARRGCLLLGSHLGSFEVLRVLGEARRGIVVNLVVHEAHARHASRWARALAPELEARIIAPGQPDTLLRVQECLERGEVVAMLGDRVLRGERSIACDFFAQQTRFPTGPLLAAALLGAPVVTFFCLFRAPRRYDVHFALLAERLPAERPARDAAVASALQGYATQLEAHARAAPWNWFNFYDFWETG